MSFHGHNIIGWSKSCEGADVYSSVNPATGLPLPSTFYIATDQEVDLAVKLASSSLSQRVGSTQRSKFLLSIASHLEELGDSWLEIAHLETTLPVERLIGERARTVNQMRLFADLVAEGSWVDARIDHGDSGRQPSPKPDLRRMLRPIGPVAVFGASNFPFAYSVAGGDTASALAAGCPVIVKAHPAHPGTSELAASAIVSAALDTGMPEGIFSMVHGANHVGITLVQHDDLAATGFTGSLQGGKALMLAASARTNPIPVHAEMGSVNPVFILPSALQNRFDEIAAQLAKSVTGGVGQFCTQPGLVIVIDGPHYQRFKEKLGAVIQAISPGVMLTAGIRNHYLEGISRLKTGGVIEVHDNDSIEPPTTTVSSALFEVDAQTFQSRPELAEEVFGPETVIVRCSNAAELMEVARALSGQLTASVHGEDEELTEFADLIATLTATVGRIIFNGYPTGVEVNPSMTHGGPYPATSDSRFTSVGTAAIFRFARPVTWQNAPESQLPQELQESNPLKIRRLVDGKLVV